MTGPWVPLPDADPNPGSSPGYDCPECSRPNPCPDHDPHREPTDDDLYNRPGVEGGIGYTDDTPGSLGENDWRL